MTWQTWTGFVVLVTVLCFTPGPTVLLTISQSLAHGTRKSLWAIFGILAANTLYFALSAIGISAILLTFQNVFVALRWIGTAYLVWLGLRDIFGSAMRLKIVDAGRADSQGRLFNKGFVLQITNPGSLVFFSAMLPQFLSPQSPIIPQTLILTVTCNVIEFAVLVLYALAVSRFSRIILAPRFAPLITKISGGLLIVAALSMALLR